MTFIKYLKEHIGESKTLAISKWKTEVTTLKKEKKNLFNQILEIRKVEDKNAIYILYKCIKTGR